MAQLGENWDPATEMAIFNRNRIGDYYHYMIAAPAAARAWRNNCLAARGARETGARLAGR